MEGRYPNGVFCVLANCADPAREAELNDWYHTVHIPEVTRRAILANATRYANPGAKGGASDPKYLGIYEITRGDLQAAWKEHASHGRELSPSPPTVERVLTGVFQRVGDLPDPRSDRRTRGVVVALTDCADPSREAEFNRWYDQVHVPDVLATGLCWSAMRYENIAPGPGQPRYLALYETDGDGPAALKALTGRLDRSRMLDACVPRHAWAFNLVFSQAWTRPGASRA